MSKPATNVEIEDVLSSIRRLISEDGRDSRVVTRPVSTPPPPMAEVASAKPQIEPQPENEPEAAPEPRAAELFAAERLVLTPALRVLSRDDAGQAEPPEAPEAMPEIAEAAPASEPDDASAEQVARDTEQSVSDFLRRATSREAAPAPDLMDDGDDFARTHDAEAEQADSGAFDADDLTPEDEPEESATAAHSDAPATGQPLLEDDAPADASGEGRETATAVEERVVEAAEVEATLLEPEPEPETEAQVEALGSEAQAETLDFEPEPEPEPEPESAGVTTRMAELEKLMRNADDAEYDDVAPDDAAAFGAIPFRHAAPPRAAEFGDDDAPDIDEDALRDLVAEIVRQELQGALGERITRNVRKLVRREIHRALASQDID